MGEFIISGNASEKFMQLVTINDVSKLTNGQAQYNAMCNENGGIIDDIIIYKKNSEYMMVVNASNIDKNFDWLESNMIEDVSCKKYKYGHWFNSDTRSIFAQNFTVLIEARYYNLSFYHFIEEIDIFGKVKP